MSGASIPLFFCVFQEQRPPLRHHQRWEHSPVHEWGEYPPLFLCVFLLLTGVHAGFPFSLTIFSSHQVPKDSSTDISLGLAPGSGGSCNPSSPSSRQTDKSSGLTPCPLPYEALCSEIPARGSSQSSHRVKVNQVSHVSVKLTFSGNLKPSDGPTALRKYSRCDITDILDVRSYI